MDDLDVIGGHLEPSLDLLKFYKQKIVGFEEERANYLQKFADVEAQNSELHRLRWELRAREDEIQELQKTLSDAKVYLYDEREQVLKLLAENDSLKTQEIEDRRRIQHLLALTEPLTHEVTFFRDGSFAPRPASASPSTAEQPKRAASKPVGHTVAGAGVPKMSPSTQLGRSGYSLAASVAEVKVSGAMPAKDASPQTSPPTNPLVLEPLSSTLEKTIQSLREQLAHERTLADERVQALLRDRNQQRESQEKKAAADAVIITQLTRQLELTQQKLTDLTRDYLMQRHSFRQYERAHAEEIAKTKAVNRDLEAELAALRCQATEELRILKISADQHSRALRYSLENTSDTLNDEIKVLKGAHGVENERHKQMLQNKEDQLTSLKQKYDDLQVRRAREIEGFTTDIAMIRKALKQLEHQWVIASGAISGAQLKEEFDNLRENLAAASSIEAANMILEGHQQYYPDDCAILPEDGENYLQEPVRASRSTSRRRSTSNARSSTTVEFIPQVKDFTVPVRTTTANDPSKRARLRVNGGLLSNRPVVYRTIKSSGYGPSGRQSMVVPQDINAAAMAPQLRSLQVAESDIAPLMAVFNAVYDSSLGGYNVETSTMMASRVGSQTQEAVSAAEEAAAEAVEVATQLQNREQTMGYPSRETTPATATPPTPGSRRISGSALRVPSNSPEAGHATFGSASKESTLRAQLDSLRSRLQKVDSKFDKLAHQ